ncbi:MAG: HAMP domain-containing protein [Chloroflexi bacterium]|nr:HAMP domain-containing protein [Chloroflexota bacterium]
MQHIFVVSLGGALFILVIGGLGIYWLSGYVLRPIRILTQHVTSVDPHNLDQRFPTEGPDDEIRQLTEAFNQMLARLSRMFEQQQRFVSDAAHELRTPLATLRMTLETALANPHASAATYRETMYIFR